ncbi:MAG: hypothetical protein ABIZ96_06390 [Gemmatimonadales bacterium]
MISPSCCRVLLGLSLMASVAPRVVSQTPDTIVTPGWSPIGTELNRMKLSSRIRLQTTTTGRQEGRLFFRTADSVGLRRPEGEVHLPLLAVDSLWIRRHYMGTGFLVGALVGAAAYVLITSSEEDSEIPELDNLAGGLFWAGSVALGTVVGRLIPRWKRVHPN